MRDSYAELKIRHLSRADYVKAFAVFNGIDYPIFDKGI